VVIFIFLEMNPRREGKMFGLAGELFGTGGQVNLRVVYIVC
jgi:hypothetical protein